MIGTLKGKGGKMRYLYFVIALLMIAGCAVADDIVTMPTANQLKAGEVDVAVYYIKLDNPQPAPQQVHYQTVYVGVTDRLEIDAHFAQVHRDRDSTVLVASYKALSETPKQPDVVIGCRNLTGSKTTNNPSVKNFGKDRSYFVAAAKTFFADNSRPGPPLLRVHLGVGTADHTLMGEVRHRGLFGGLQFLLRPDIGMVAEHDGQDMITALTYMPKNTGLTIKGGGYGKHWWAGAALRKTF
jgi:hypothetical protein